MTIEEYHMICKKIDKEGKVELEVVDEDENRKRMFATEYVAIQKKFIFEDPNAPWVYYKNAFIV